MVKYRVAGPDALRFLNRLVTRDLRKLRPGRVAYVVWCNDQGHLIDDGTVFCLGEGEYRLCTAERQLDWLLDSSLGFDVSVAEVTEEVAALAVQGPTSCAVLKAMGLAGVEQLKPFELGTFVLQGAAAAPLMVSRTGFTGDLGYELWMRPADAEAVWDALMEAGRTRGIRPIGSRALNIARIEAGFLLPNVDFVSGRAHAAPRHRALAARARARLAGRLRQGTLYRTARAARGAASRRTAPPGRGSTSRGTKPAHNALLYDERGGRRQVGSVTSAIWSPTCKRNLALAMVDAPHFAHRSRGVG